MELLNHFEAVWRHFKQRPSKGNMIAYNKRFGTSVTYTTYSRRWGGFREFGERFADYKLGKIRLDELLTNPNQFTRVGLSASLRAKVLERDKYTCRDCGASPRKDPEVNLHIHHILPVSQGGKDEMNNLITNCNDCNQGKSDVIVNNELFE